MNHIEQFRALTAREREVLDLFCQGLPYREIGERLFISVKGVKSHMQHIYQKLGLMHLPPKARAFTLREEYWPLVKAEPKPAQEEPEPEIIEPIPAEVEELIDSDEATMKALVVAEPVKLAPPPKLDRPRRRRSWRSCLAWSFMLLAIIGGAVWYFGGFGMIGMPFRNFSQHQRRIRKQSLKQ